MSKHRKNSQKRKKQAVMPGVDYGMDRSTAVMTAPDFNDQFRKANVIACAYGQTQVPGLAGVLPCISMVARNPEPLLKAFQQFKAWIEATGPDALKVEILYSAEGYYIAFGPEYKHAMWRTVGIDQFSNPAYFGVTYIKTIDSRHSILDRIAEYTKRPVAPIVLLGAHYTGTDPKKEGPKPSEMSPIDGCPELLLFGLPIYKSNSEVPEFSGLRMMAFKPARQELEASRKEFEEVGKSAESMRKTRERRLSALMPVTLHMLRTHLPLQPKIADLVARGIESWQIEQAVVNQRLWLLVDPQSRARLQNRKDLRAAIDQFVELDSPDWNGLLDGESDLIDQIYRDARALLKSVGTIPPDNLRDCQRKLAELGYIKGGMQ